MQDLNMSNMPPEWNEDGDAFYRLRLFVTGTSPHSARAIGNVKKICEQYMPGRYELEIVDVYQQPLLVKEENVTAVPMLIKNLPLPKKRLVGDMSDTNKVLKGLGLL